MLLPIIFALFFLITTPDILNAQPEVEWMRLYGDNQIDQFFAHVRTVDGGWAFGGRRGGQPCNNWLVKTDAEGETELFEVYNINNGQGQAMDLVQTEDGGYLLAGAISDDNGVDPSAIRVDANGDEMWGRLYGGEGSDHFRAVAATKRDQFILAGFSSSWIDTTEDGQLIAGGLCGYLVLIRGNNEIIWQDIYGGLETDWLEDVIVVDGGYVAAGRSRSFGDGSHDLWLLRVDEDGNEVWSFAYGNEASENGWAVIRTEEDNGFAIAGFELVRDPENERERLYHPILLKLDENGEEEWFNRYVIEGLQVYIHDVVRTPDNGYALVGSSCEDDPLQRLAYILYLDVDGNVMWDRSDAVENGETHEYNSAVLAEDGGVTAAGQAYGRDLEGDYQGLFSKIAPANLPPVIFERNPEDSVLFVLQNDTCVFSVDARDPEGADLSYQWVLDEEIVSEEDMIILDFPEIGNFNLRVDVSDGVWTTSARWLIHVFALISGYFPLDSALTVPLDTLIHFGVQVGVEDDTLAILYTLDGDSIGANPVIDVLFNELGEHIVQADVMARGCRDSVAWRITVINPNSVCNEFGKPYAFILHESYPNPFNATTTIKYFLPVSAIIKLSVYDTSGRLMRNLVNGRNPEGAHQITLNAVAFPAGIYFVRFQIEDHEQIFKIVLIR